MTAPKNLQEASRRASEIVRGPGAAASTSYHNSKTLINVRNVAALLGVDRSTVWRKSANGDLPKPCRIAGLTRWSLAEVEAVIAAKLAERDEPEAA